MSDKDKKTLKDFGNNLRNIRKSLNLSQEQVADKANLHRTYIGMLERGEKNITFLNILKVSKALKKTPAQLMEFLK